MKKLIALFLLFAMLLSLAACTSTPTNDPAKTPAAENQAKELYMQAGNALESLSHVTLDLVITTHTTVDGDEFSSKSAQTLTYQAKGSQDAIIVMEENVEFSIHARSEETEEDLEPTQYKETWHHGTVYAQLDDEHYFRSSMDSNTAANRYTPVLLLDPALYSSITAQETANGTLIQFAAPTACEKWLPAEDCTLVEASGDALINTAGNLAEMNYTVSYTYGASQVAMTVSSKPLATPKTVSAPEKTDAYTALTNIDAVRACMYATFNLVQTDDAVTQYSEVIFSDAAGYLQDYTVMAAASGRRDETVAKIETTVHSIDYSTQESNEYRQEVTYRDGKLTTVDNGGLPSSTNSSWETVRAYVGRLLVFNIDMMDYWKDATITDLGSLYFLELRLNDSFGNATQNYICQMLWDDPAFLTNLATDYENAEMTAYVSIDKYTGLPVAAGHYFKGIHTIDGYKYEMTMQLDQSIQAPTKGAYHTVTNAYPPQEEPATKATPLFYRVTGKDGQEMWLLGTVHVGDNRTAYLPEEIYNAFTASDALAVECNPDLFAEQVKEDSALAEKVSALYYCADGDVLIQDAMTEEEYASAEKLLKATGNYRMDMSYAKPHFWSSCIEQFYLYQGHQLHSDLGVESQLESWAKEQGKDILEIESSYDQLKMSSDFSSDLQMYLLKDIIEYGAQAYWMDTMELYELWCAGKESELREMLANDFDESKMTPEEIAAAKPLFEEYTKAMHTDRNAKMLTAAIEYLESGETIFYAVGLAHLLDNTNGLVDALQKAGYTVEQVTFKN